MLRLKSYQKEIIKYILDKQRCAVFASMGTGKTVSVLSAIDIMYLTKELTKKVLIIAPLRVARTTWPEEIDKWPHLKDLTISVISGNATERIAALKKDVHIYAINYENLIWLDEILGGKWPFEMVVADESTKLKGFRTRQGTKRSRAIGKHAHTHIKRFIQLTGTPAPNGVKDLWACGWFIDAGHRLGRTYSSFVDRWFRRSWNGFTIEPMPYAQKEIEEKLKDVCITIDAKDHFDISEPIVNCLMVDLPDKAMKKYKEMEKRMFTELDDVFKSHAVEALNAASRTMKCLQLANGAAYVEGDNKQWVEVHDVKIKALEEIIEEANGMPVLVAYNFRSDLARLKKAFPQGRVLDKDPQTIRDWNAGKIPVLFAHPASAGHGISLQDGGNIMVFFSVNWNLEEHTQIIERIGPVRQKQAGYDRPVFVYYILAKGTVDLVIKHRLETKESVQDSLLKALKGDLITDRSSF